jgi:hypothetical protein
MIRTVRRIEISIPQNTKNRYPDGMIKGSDDVKIWYPVICEKSMVTKNNDSEQFEYLVFGVIGKDGYLVWVPAYTVQMREDITFDSGLRLIVSAIDALKRVYPVSGELLSIDPDRIFLGPTPATFSDSVKGACSDK